MSQISNFPQNLLDEHKNWHHARHNVNIGNPPPGYGYEFLRFHRDYISRALDWYNKSGNDPRLVEAWAFVPESIRQSSCYNHTAEARILFQPESFTSADELGRFIESSNLHACIHQQSASMYGDSDINDFDVAPHDTVFYNIHGMVDRWWRNWEGLGRFRENGCHWYGAFESDGGGKDNEILYYDSREGYWWLGKSRQNNANEQDEIKVDWAVIGDSRGFGPMDDGRCFRIWDTDDDGKLEVLFQLPQQGYWVEGKVKGGQLLWQPVHLRPQGLSFNP